MGPIWLTHPRMVYTDQTGEDNTRSLVMSYRVLILAQLGTFRYFVDKGGKFAGFKSLSLISIDCELISV